MKLPKELIPIVIALAALIAVSVLFKRNESARSPQMDHIEYTSYSTGKRGAKAFYLLLDKLGYKPKRLHTPYDTKMNSGKLAFLLAPQHAIKETTAQRLVKWVRKGNTLVFIPRTMRIAPRGGRDPFAKALQINVHRRFPRNKTLTPDVSTELTTGIENLVIQSGNRIRTKREDVTRYFGDRAGMVALSLPEEKGTVIAISDPYIITNAGMTEGDNLNLITNILFSYAASAKTVYIDEYHHGFVKQRTIWDILKETPLGFALVQVALAIILLMYSRGRRFGQPKPVLKEAHRSSTEYVTSLASIYQATKASDIALSSLYERLLRSVRNSSTGEDVVELLDECRRKMRDEKLSEKELLNLSKRIALAQSPSEGG